MSNEARVNTFFGETVYYKDVGEERSVIPHPKGWKALKF
jgi:hypothetical protein